MTITEARIGRPPRKTPLTDAERQARRRAREARFGVKEVRGLRGSTTERAMLDALTTALGYGSRAEMVFSELRKVADQHGVDYRVPAVACPVCDRTLLVSAFVGGQKHCAGCGNTIRLENPLDQR